MAVSEEIQEKMLEEATSATPNFTVDMNSQQFKDIDKDIEDSWNEYHQTVGGSLNNVDKFYNDLSDQAEKWADKQAQIQQENTDFIIKKTEQEIAKAEKNYQKEQSGAYVDWQKQSNQYGVEAEKKASAGLTGSGYSESSQVSMYNAYQNRVAVARETVENIIMNYNNNIKEAQLQNSAALAQIYADLAEKQLNLALEGFMYKDQLTRELASKKLEMENVKWNRYQDVLQQLNTENALKWDVTKYYDTQKWQEKQAEIEHNRQLERDKINNDFTARQAELDREHDFALVKANTAAAKEKADYEHKLALERLKQEQKDALARIDAQYDKQLENEKAMYDYKQSHSGTEITGSSTPKVGSYDKSVRNKAQNMNKSTSVKTNTPYFVNRDEGIEYAKKMGVPASQANGIWDMGEWSRKKNASSTSAAIKNTKSYSEYLNLQVAFLIDEYAK